VHVCSCQSNVAPSPFAASALSWRIHQLRVMGALTPSLARQQQPHRGPRLTAPKHRMTRK
jgi:hypothetical protein